MSPEEKREAKFSYLLGISEILNQLEVIPLAENGWS